MDGVHTAPLSDCQAANKIDEHLSIEHLSERRASPIADARDTSLVTCCSFSHTEYVNAGRGLYQVIYQRG
jgi:hypothetical protein